MTVSLTYHVYLTDSTGKKTELPGSPYPTTNTADAAIASYESAHPGTGGYYDEVRRFDQAGAPPPVVTPPPTANFQVATLAAVAVVGQPTAFQATLRNNTASAVPSPGVGFYDTNNKQLGWLSSSSQTVAPGASITLTNDNAENKADWTPTTDGATTVVAKPGSNGVDSDTGAFRLAVTVAKAATTPPPVTPPPATGARDCSLWPFVASDPFNTPLGNGATWTPIRDRGTPYVNIDSWSIPVYFAKTSDPAKNFNASGGSHPGNNTVPNFPAGAQPAQGTDKHLAIISPDRRYSYEMWNCNPGAGTSGTFMKVDLQSKGVGLGWCRATGVSILAGLIRKDEMTAGLIPHALAMAGSQGWVGAGGQPWPAISNDDGNSGEGSWLGIPQSVPMPSGLSKAGQAIFTALKTYGGMNVDIAGSSAPVFYAEPGSSDPGDLSKLAGLIQRVTNYSQSNVGGPGARVGPAAPGF